MPPAMTATVCRMPTTGPGEPGSSAITATRLTGRTDPKHDHQLHAPGPTGRKAGGFPGSWGIGGTMPGLFHQGREYLSAEDIERIYGVTDALDLDRDWVVV